MKYILAPFLFFILCACSSFRDVAQQDYLIYVIAEGPRAGKLVFYDLAEDLHVPILPDWDVEKISLSAKNRLAFSSTKGDVTDIYILDFPFTDSLPKNITHNSFTTDYPLAWSSDGHYLVCESRQEDRKTLSVWDGEKLFEIYQHQGQVSEVAWSFDGRLAFTEFYRFGSVAESSPSEVFIWDGETVTSLSQNPFGEDRFPVWNQANQLAFLSEQDGEYDIFVWDGKVQDNNIPDVATFKNIAADLTGFYSNPIWTNADALTFKGLQSGNEHVQVYEWNGQKAVNISQNPNYHNGAQRWRSDGYWAFVTYFSSQSLIYVRDEKNQTEFSTEAQSVPAWGPSGQLLFCTKGAEDWILNMWNGTDRMEIVRGRDIDVLWQNGQGTHCTSG